MRLRSAGARIMVITLVLQLAQPVQAYALDVFTLEAILQALKTINGFAGKVQDRIGMAYPAGVDQAIRTWLEPMFSIQDEMRKLSCDWRWSPRTLRMRRVFEGGFFCKPDMRLYFGSYPYHNDRDELYDWKAALRMNLISNRFKTSHQRHEAARLNIRRATVAGLTDQVVMAATGGLVSPGESQRITALVTAQLGQLAVETGDTWTQMLDQDLDRFNERRYRRRLEMVAGLSMYNFPQTPVPTPSSGMLVIAGETR